MSRYDFAVIGGGIGGLIMARILAKKGKKVILLEKGKHLGGAIQGFSRMGVTFDTGAHYIGGIEKGQNLYQYFKYLGIIDELNLEKLDADAFDKITFESNGKTYSYAQGYDNFVEVMSRDFPENRKEIQKYVDEIRKVGEAYPMYSLDISKGTDIKLNDEHLYQSVGEFLDGITQNEELKNVLAASNLVYAGDNETTPYYVHALILNSYLSSSYRFVGGASQLAYRLAEKIEEENGEVRTKAEVVQFKFGEGKEIISAVLKNGEEIFADNFISNVHPAVTLDMVPKDKIRKAYRSRIKGLENTYSVFSIYIVLKPETFNNQPYNSYYFSDDDIWSKDNGESSWPKTFMMITQSSTKNSTYADGITAISPMDYSLVEEWADSEHKKRPQSYHDFSQKMGDKLLDLLEKKHPGLRDKIKYYEVSTPLSYEHYTNSPRGSLYGIIRNAKDPLRTHIAPYTKVPNLFFVGQNIDIHGILGVTVGAFMAAGLFFDIEQILSDVKHC
jgi:all-trans-retinol 13,14-reductase